MLDSVRSVPLLFLLLTGAAGVAVWRHESIWIHLGELCIRRLARIQVRRDGAAGRIQRTRVGIIQARSNFVGTTLVSRESEILSFPDSYVQVAEGSFTIPRRGVDHAKPARVGPAQVAPPMGAPPDRGVGDSPSIPQLGTIPFSAWSASDNFGPD